MKKLVATGLAIVMALTVFVTPANVLTAKAEPSFNEGRVYTNNHTEFQRVSISTPESTARLYAGLTWEQLKANVGVRLNVRSSECGPDAIAAYQFLSASLGANLHCILDMDFEKYVNEWCSDIVRTNNPIRVAFDLPAGWDTTLDYAVISVTDKGTFEILGDIDANPASITFDSQYFDTFAVISAPAGAFNAYRVVSPNALDEIAIPNYVKSLASSIKADSISRRVMDAAIVTDAATVVGAVGQEPNLEITECKPGPMTIAAMTPIIAQTNTVKYTFCELNMYSGYTKVDDASEKLLVTVTTPYDFPAYTDYAVITIDENGAVTLKRDLDIDPSSVSFFTDDFRTIAIICGPKGAYDAYPVVF